MRFLLSVFILSLALTITEARAADCLLQATGHTRKPGTIVFNSDHDVIQFCTNTGAWKSVLGVQGPKGDPGIAGASGDSLWSANGANIHFSSGDVGIGTDLPSSALQVLGTITADGFAGPGALLTSLDAGQLTTGTVGTARLGSGTADGTTFLRGDGTWQAAPAGADNLGDHIATTVLRSDTHNTDDLGTTAIRWKDGWFAGTVTAGTFDGSGASLTALNASQLTTGTVGAARLGSGTADGSTFLRGDGQWATSLTRSGTAFTATTTGTTTAGVTAIASSTTGSNWGVYGRSDSVTGRGVAGNATATTGINYGVRGDTSSTTGRGVLAFATATTGVNFGVRGDTNSTTGRGVLGFAAATTGSNYGVIGESQSTTGTGVSGYASATSGVNYGVTGDTDSTVGSGVYGRANATSGINYGVYGRSWSSSGIGIYGQNATAGGWGMFCSSGHAAGCGGNRTWTVSSDLRLKKDVQEIGPSGGLDAIMRLRPVTYRWRTGDEDDRDYGFIAQEVREVFPELVGKSMDQTVTDDDGGTHLVTDVLAVRYTNIIAPLVKAVQELKEENDALKAQNAAFEARFTALEERVAEQPVP